MSSPENLPLLNVVQNEASGHHAQARNHKRGKDLQRRQVL